MAIAPAALRALPASTAHSLEAPRRPGRLSCAGPHARPFGACRPGLRQLPQRSAPPPPGGASEPPAVVAGLMAEAQASEAAGLVDEVLTKIEGTDSGDNMTAEERQRVDASLSRLDEIGEAKELRPLEDPLVFGNYNVAYVSTGNKQAGQPAGGRFRGGLGKLLFRTTLLAQSVLQPDLVTNKVEFKLFGVLPGSVGLRGRFVSIPEREGGPDRKDTVKAR